MITQRKQLEEKLIDNGLRIVQRACSSGKWYVDEEWTIESVWSPTGLKLYITFLVDPRHDGDRKKGESVWAVTAGVDPPASPCGNEGDPLIALRPKWEKHLPDFIAEVSRLR